MVAFARAKAKSILSKLWLRAISTPYTETKIKEKKKDKLLQQEKSSNHFLDAIKSGGIWLS